MCYECNLILEDLVALLTEGVDRNLFLRRLRGRSRVALLTEGVDRNLAQLVMGSQTHVALLTEGVDRNLHFVYFPLADDMSPSSRRAWIEISSSAAAVEGTAVALLTEGVDRNPRTSIPAIASVRRPPHGGRG